MIAALTAALRADVHAPVRASHSIEVPGSPAGSLLLMPAWQVGNRMGVKLVTVFPGKQPRESGLLATRIDARASGITSHAGSQDPMHSPPADGPAHDGSAELLRCRGGLSRLRR